MQTKQPISSSSASDHAANLRALYEAWYSKPYPDALDETMRDCPIIDKEDLPDALWGAVNQVDPDVRLRREEFSEDPVVKAAQCLNVAYASLFELSYPPDVPRQFNLKLPGGHLLGKTPIYTETIEPRNWGTPSEIKHAVTKSAPDSEFSSNLFPPVGYTKGDEGDSIRALVGIAHYVTKLLAAYPIEKIRPVARKLGGWPVMLQRADMVARDKTRRKGARLAEAATLRIGAQLEDIQLGEACTIDVLRRSAEKISNQVVVRELIDIHEYLVNSAEWDFRRKQKQDRDRMIVEPQESETLSREEWDAMPRKFIPFSKWKEGMETATIASPGGWQALAISLPPLSQKTVKQWWPVVWEKLVSDRAGNVHLKPDDPSLFDLSSLCVDRAREAIRRNRKGNMLKEAESRTGSRKKAHLDKKMAELDDQCERLEAVNCMWCGNAATELELAGTTIGARDAKDGIRRTLKEAFERILL